MCGILLLCEKLFNQNNNTYPFINQNTVINQCQENKNDKNDKMMKMMKMMKITIYHHHIQKLLKMLDYSTNNREIESLYISSLSFSINCSRFNACLNASSKSSKFFVVK